MDTLLINNIMVYVKELLKPLEDTHNYHNYYHTLDVYNRAQELSKKENIGDENTELLLISALFHDTGFILNYDENEYLGARIAHTYLKRNSYDNKKINKIENIIIATIPSLKPENLFEEIIKDADTDNLGRDDFFIKTELIRTELNNIKNLNISKNDWLKSTLNFLNSHTFYTKTEKKERNEKKEEIIKKVKELIK